jgi:1-aminocyclopropane-1-carboxylate deaminase/D-cysteine desulfhydrase-like pyridoxal-dependent ACC family enzyme
MPLELRHPGTNCPPSQRAVPSTQGGRGFVGFAEAVHQQEAELGFKFDYIVSDSVAVSAQAGMVVGFAV